MPNHTHEWADEDIGMNCGRYSYREGERVEEYFPDTQKDRIEFASSVMDVSPQDYALFVKRHVKHKKRENPKKAVKKQNTPYKLRIYGVYEV